MRFAGFDTSSGHMLIAASGKKQAYTAIYAPRTLQEEFFPALEKLLEQSGLKIEEIEFIAAGIGPGSYTSLRVGITAARTMAQVLDVPVYALDSLRLGVYAALRIGYEEKKVTVIRKLRKGEYYATVYSIEEKVLTVQEPHIVSSDRITAYQNRICLKGDAEAGAAIQFVPDGSELIAAIKEAVSEQEPVSWQELLPLYLRKSYAEERD